MVLAERVGQRDLFVVDGDGSQLNQLAISDSELSSLPESESETESPAKCKVSSCLSSNGDDGEGTEGAGSGKPRRSRRERRRNVKAAELSWSWRQARRRAREMAAERKSLRRARGLAEQVGQLIHDRDSDPAL